MQIKKAYLFSRLISAGGTPPMPPNVYFENGVFNTSLVPTGFNFNSNVEVYDYDDDYDRLIWDGDYHDDAVNGTIARIQKGNPTGNDSKWVLQDGVLRFQHAFNENYIGETLFLPVVGWTSPYEYTCIQFRLITEENLWGEVFFSTYSYDDWLIEQGQYCYDICHTSGGSGSDSGTRTIGIHSVNQDAIPFQSIDLIELFAVMDDYEKSFTIEVIKIWGSNTEP